MEIKVNLVIDSILIYLIVYILVYLKLVSGERGISLFFLDI